MEQVNAKRAIIFAVAACLVGMAVGSALTLAVLQHTYSISNIAQAKAVGVDVYADQALSVRVSEINWRLIDPGASKYYTACIRNSGNSPLTSSLRAKLRCFVPCGNKLQGSQHVVPVSFGFHLLN